MSIDDQLKEAELEKIRAEATKFQAEARDISTKRKTVIWADNLKIIGAVVLAVGGIVAAVTQYHLAELKVEQAEYELEITNKTLTVKKDELDKLTAKLDSVNEEIVEKEKYVAQLKEGLANLAVEASEAQPELTKRRLVYVQFRGSLTRASINEYREQLTKSGFQSPGAERLSGEYSSSVRYFDEGDYDEAVRLAEATEDYFREKGCALTLEPIFLDTSQLTHPPLEVWIDYSCST